MPREADTKQKQEPSKTSPLLSTTGCTVTRPYYNLTPLTAGKVTFNKEFESSTHLVVMKSFSNTGAMLQMQGSVILKNNHPEHRSTHALGGYALKAQVKRCIPFPRLQIQTEEHKPGGLIKVLVSQLLKAGVYTSFLGVGL